ncbi:histidyl-tRNA synthetase [Pontibacter aydingkolensis]|uniref:Histidine--tRNA ligase n=1 Tax=Pontibacter aydingkolensis TaxID=1911536 RepID=A0ABS7CVM8_9BACT|nr:histidine--tRNA ligase [Pontibacter aydingkolensis]MBW7467918.1 histidine--tRNA ligase [Pontibacter aydingkolensis]
MSKEKPSIPKGTRDFGPAVVVKRNYIFNIIKRTFEKFGYLPLETPAMEQLSVLTGKYGDEGDQLLFKILNSGDFMSKTRTEDIEQGHKHLTRKVSEKGLRYDLTVPFARFVVMNRNEITFPFKRYQIQPVWRADRPQRGRYREFYQCDADVVGTNSLLCEAEIVQMINEVLTMLGLTDFTIKINHRGILSGIAEAIGEKGREGDICVAIDKLDKIGKEGVRKELIERGISEEAVSKLEPLYTLEGNNEQILDQLQSILGETTEGARGLKDLHEVWQYLSALKSQALTATNDSGNPRLMLDVTLARGLSYYTGCIFEVKVNNVSMGSISGGGRYDNLTGMFGMPGISGVGFSFGVDRIYDVLEELQLFPDSSQVGTKVLLVQFDKESEMHALPILQQLRNAGIASELYPEPAKLKKQMGYADQKNIPYVILIGSEEIATGKLKLRNMQQGEQQDLTIEEIISVLKN